MKNIREREPNPFLKMCLDVLMDMGYDGGEIIDSALLVFFDGLYISPDGKEVRHIDLDGVPDNYIKWLDYGGMYDHTV